MGRYSTGVVRMTAPYADAEPKETVLWNPSPQELALFDLSDAKSHLFLGKSERMGRGCRIVTQQIHLHTETGA